MASTGARGKSMGSISASSKPTTRAKGLTFKRSADSVVAKTSAVAPSFKVDAFPACHKKCQVYHVVL